MPRSSFSGALTGPQVDVIIDLGNPLLNHTVDGFLKIGTVAATRAVAEDAFSAAKKDADHIELRSDDDGGISTKDFEHTLKKMCKEGAYWGTVAGLYVGAEYGIERVRGRRDWKNAMLGGALTGALVSAASKENKDKVLVDAITGGAHCDRCGIHQLSRLNKDVIFYPISL
ncbi:outer envelope pore protein 16, chloroplastic-like isoform X1 [Malus domestica]|uniref:outer envelope pore protein 16, chloroplastic-like isoform X1 n=1 Tax=Malus domestica TaxID=3750 RepID=UPI0010AA9479|nr:outer envelope pore protein 16, chloroplastic-like isoform X1 [Malus domestica]